jgi:hypothetical protein
MSPHTKKLSVIYERRLRFRQFVQSGNRKTVSEALAFAKNINFSLAEHDIAHLILNGNWKVETFVPTEDDRADRKTNREKVHGTIGDDITKHYSNSEIEIIEPWSRPA